VPHVDATGPDSCEPLLSVRKTIEVPNTIHATQVHAKMAMIARIRFIM
jgi:hypothetical protein